MKNVAHAAAMAAAPVVFTCLVPIAAFAGPMSYDEALARAAAFSPSVRARDAAVDAARSSAIAADRLPDPTLDFGLKDFPVTGPDAGRFNRDDFTMTTLGLTQRFPSLAKRHARAQRAAADIGLAAAGVLSEARSVRLETALAWIDLYYGERRLAQLALLDRSLDDLQATIAGRLTAGTARPSQALEPAQLRAVVADRRADMVAAVAQARARLSRFTGDMSPAVAGSPPDPRVETSRLMREIDSVPGIRALDAATAAADADIGLARAGKRPDWALSASYGRREPRYGDLVSITMSIDLPLFGAKRQEPGIAAAVSNADRARLDREAARRQWVAALQSDMADHAMHDERLRNARDTLVPLAKRRAELDRDSYAAGKLDLGSALLSTLALAEAEVDGLDREADVARDAVRINVTYAGGRP